MSSALCPSTLVPESHAPRTPPRAKLATCCETRFLWFLHQKDSSEDARHGTRTKSFISTNWPRLPEAARFWRSCQRADVHEKLLPLATSARSFHFCVFLPLQDSALVPLCPFDLIPTVKPVPSTQQALTSAAPRPESSLPALHRNAPLPSPLRGALLRRASFFPVVRAR